MRAARNRFVEHLRFHVEHGARPNEVLFATAIAASNVASLHFRVFVAVLRSIPPLFPAGKCALVYDNGKDIVE